MNIELITLGLSVANTVGLGYLAWSQTIGEHRRFKHQTVVDTSGLIDGRIIDIVRSGFIPQRLIIPQFVVSELQFLADQGDAFKRERARFGLDVIRRLQEMRQTEVVIPQGRVRGEKQVDDKLVSLAKKHGALLYTTDFNLNQVAQIEGVRVLNVNELAQGVRATRLPGEKGEIKITNVGQDRSQGVGYMEDGTMVVVENAGKLVGQKAVVVYSRMLQTQAGKMMFATLAANHKYGHSEEAARPVSAPQRPAGKPHYNNSAVPTAAAGIESQTAHEPKHELSKYEPKPHYVKKPQAQKEPASVHASKQQPRKYRTQAQAESSLVELANGQNNANQSAVRSAPKPMKAYHARPRRAPHPTQPQSKPAAE